MVTSPRGVECITLNKTTVNLFLQSLAEYALVVFIAEWLGISA
jgi:hypothetical protein